MDPLDLLTLVDNAVRAAALGFIVGVLLWLFRRIPVVQRIRTSAIFAVLGWATFWVLSAISDARLDPFLKIMLSVAILLSANIGVQIFDAIVWRGLAARRGKRVLPRLLLEILNVGLMVAATLLVLNGIYAVDLSALLVTSTVISAVIGLALQDMLGNVVSGLALQFDRSIEVEDWVSIGGQEGRVIGMNWRTVTINTIDNHAVTIPNSTMAKNEVVNYSKPTLHQRMHVRIGLPYGAPPGLLKRILLPAVMRSEGVLPDPRPDILVAEYGDSAIIYDVRFWIGDYSRRHPIRDEVLARIWYAIRREGVSVPFPIRDVNLRTISDEQIKIEAIQEKDRVFEALRPLPIFAPLNDAQIRKLSDGAERQLYYAGEILVQQGDEGDSLFVVESGTARVEFLNSKGVLKQLAVGPPDDFFGEMSLLTGERRRASVIAQSDMQVVIVGKSALAEVLRDDLGSLEALTEIMKKRLEKIVELADAEMTIPGGIESGSLFSSISKFLGVGNKGN